MATESCDAFPAERPRPVLSVVAPCYNEEAGLEEFHRRVSAACHTLGLSHEIVLVDDGSRDQTWTIIRALAQTDHAVRGLRLSRNHGHQLALTAGLQAARGARVLMIDADLQDPPELLGDLIQRMDETGADVVFGRRVRRDGERLFKRATAQVFYRVLNWFSDMEIPRDTGDFRLVSRRVLDVLNSLGEHNRFLRGLVSWVGFEQVPLDYVRAGRHAGETGYPLRKMLRFAADALTSFSIGPLRIASYFGIVCSFFALLVAAYAVVQWALGHTVQGWTSLIVVILIIGAMQLVVLGIIGEYLGRLFLESKQRPLYTLRETTDGSGVIPSLGTRRPQESSTL